MHPIVHRPIAQRARTAALPGANDGPSGRGEKGRIVRLSCEDRADASLRGVGGLARRCVESSLPCVDSSLRLPVEKLKDVVGRCVGTALAVLRPMHGRTLGWLASVAMLGAGSWAGCIGEIGDGGADGGEQDTQQQPGDFACTPGDPSATVLPRLSRSQYLRTLRAYAVDSLGDQEADAVMTALTSTLSLLPLDASTDHDRLDQAVSQGHVDAQYHLAEAFAAELTSTPARREVVLGSCAEDADPSNDDACLDELIRTLGYRAHRRPLSQAEVDFYRDEIFEPADGLELAAARDVIAAMLLSPNFLYRVEIEGDPVDGRDDLYELSAHELAARLAFHFWDGPPDAELYAVADSGELLTEEGYAAAVDRMLDDPRTFETIDRLYAEWLLLDDLAPLHQLVGDPIYDAFVGSDVPTPELRDRIIEDSLDLARHTTWQSDGTFADLFLSELSFAKTPDVAAIYGNVPLWVEGTEPATLPAGERAGLLTRPAMLATGSTNTHPVLRGREVRKRILCQDTPPPPADAMDDLPELDPITSERDRMEAYTEQPGSSCVGCHSQMNPIGYTMEGYDGLGRVRSEEMIFDTDGTVLASLPLDTAAVPALEAGDDREVADAVELSELVAESNVARACFARHYFRFTFARLEDDDVDGCELEAIREGLAEGRSLRHVLRDIAMTPTFRLRKLAD